MKITRLRIDHVAFYVIHFIAVLAIGSSNDPLTGENNLKYNCSQHELSLNLPITGIQSNFINSSHIRCLTLEGNQIEWVANGALDDLPALEYLNMVGNMITKLVSFGGHKNLRTLILANQSLPDDTDLEVTIPGRYPELRYLDLSGNKIRSIEWTSKITDGFYHWELHVKKPNGNNCHIFPKLEYLDLSNNVMNTFFHNDEHSVFNLNLTHLFLHNNRLYHVNLQYFKNLTVLTVDNNYIQTLDRQYCNPTALCISDMPKLKYLSISNNLLRWINGNFFELMPELVKLNLSNNQLTNDIYGAFQNLFSLEDLNIDNNKLTNLSLFKEPVLLSSLSVNKNQIQHIVPEDLINTSKLRKLYLENNQIKSIHKYAFCSLELLEELHLANNDLTNLPADWSDNLINLRYVDLANNKFMHLESLSLSDTQLSLSIDLRKNYITSFSTNLIYNFPRNVTIHLVDDQKNMKCDPDLQDDY